MLATCQPPPGSPEVLQVLHRLRKQFGGRTGRPKVTLLVATGSRGESGRSRLRVDLVEEVKSHLETAADKGIALFLKRRRSRFPHQAVQQARIEQAAHQQAGHLREHAHVL